MELNIKPAVEIKVKTFKSLYEVKNTYIPNKDLRFLEGQEDDEIVASFMKTVEKTSDQVQEKPEGE